MSDPPSKPPLALQSSRWNRWTKWGVFSLIPTVCLIALLELSIRIVGLDQPHLRSPFLTAEFQQVHQSDDDLFFSLRPNLRTLWQGAQLTTNSLGLRYREFGPKRPGDFHILSLGESTTFGALVEDHQTYSALLERYLQELDHSHTYCVINAGVSAYTSFQSLRYLELRGLKVQPDMVLFYHEANDYLPSSIRERGGSSDELGLSLTDRQLYESTKYWLYRKLLACSATCRFIAFQAARRRISGLQGRDGSADDPNAQIVAQFKSVATPGGIRRLDLPPRVTPEERKENLERLWSLCREHGIILVVIHPSYALSTQHECELTEFCKRRNVPTIDAFHSIHPDWAESDELFLDLFHPNPQGHERLAKDLLAFLVERRLVPFAK